MKVTIRKTIVRGETKYVVSWFTNGKRNRRIRNSRKAAEEEKEMVLGQIRTAGELWASLAPSEKTEFATILSEVRANGLTMRKVWDEYKAGIGQNVKETRSLTIALQEMLRAKRANKHRERYLKGLEKYLTRFIAGRENLPVSRITTTDIEEWFSRTQEADSTRASNIGRVSALFSYCYRKNYIGFNPCDKLDRPRVDPGKPHILSRISCLRLLATCRKTDPPYLAYIVLGMLCGLRPEEAQGLTWKKINFRNGWIEVDEEVTKVRHWRHVPMERGAIKWLRWCRRFVKGPLIPEIYNKRRQRLARRARIKWNQDMLRKTAASYLMAKYQDSQKVSEILGNSPKVLKSNYRSLVSPNEAKIFWGEK